MARPTKAETAAKKKAAAIAELRAEQLAVVKEWRAAAETNDTRRKDQATTALLVLHQLLVLEGAEKPLPSALAGDQQAETVVEKTPEPVKEASEPEPERKAAPAGDQIPAEIRSMPLYQKAMEHIGSRDTARISLGNKILTSLLEGLDSVISPGEDWEDAPNNGIDMPDIQAEGLHPEVTGAMMLNCLHMAFFSLKESTVNSKISLQCDPANVVKKAHIPEEMRDGAENELRQMLTNAGWTNANNADRSLMLPPGVLFTKGMNDCLQEEVVDSGMLKKAVDQGFAICSQVNEQIASPNDLSEPWSRALIRWKNLRRPGVSCSQSAGDGHAVARTGFAV